VTDAVLTLLHLFQGGDEPPCVKAADADDEEGLNVTDVVFLLNFLFLKGERVPAPFPDCGWDMTIDELGCETYPPCE
jgi:hypothetical protein